MKKMNNKGFSLVELIIVIAIMAILIVVLAPQYLRYVERSRNSTDMQNATSIVEALQIYQADPQAANVLTNATPGTTNTATIHIDATAANSAVSAGNAQFVTDALTDTGLTLTNMRCSSRTAWTGYDIIVTLNAAGGLDVQYVSNPAATPDLFAQRMAGN